MKALLSFLFIGLFAYVAYAVNGLVTSNTPEQVAIIEPTPADTAWQSAQELYRHRKWSQAESAFENFRRQFAHDNRTVEALNLVGICRRERGDTQGAIRAWRFILHTAAGHLEDTAMIMQAAGNLFDAYEGNRGRIERERLLNRLLSDFPDDETTIRLHVREGMTRFADADFIGAIRFLSSVANRLDAPERKKLALARALTSKGAPDFQIIMDAADEYFAEDQVDQAIKLYQVAQQQKSDPNIAIEAHTKLGWCLYVKGDWQESEKLWQSVIRQGPSQSPWVARSRWHMIQLLAGPANQREKALNLCAVQAREFPGHPEGERAMLIRAWMHWTRKDWSKAKQAFEELIAAYPHTAEAPPIQKYLRDCEEGLLK